MKPNGDSKKYLFTKGRWVSKALYPYDYIPDNKKILLVEGARDALNLIQYGVYALANLGTSTWSQAKIDLLVNLKPRKDLYLHGLRRSRNEGFEGHIQRLETYIRRRHTQTVQERSRPAE